MHMHRSLTGAAIQERHATVRARRCNIQAMCTGSEVALSVVYTSPTLPGPYYTDMILLRLERRALHPLDVWGYFDLTVSSPEASLKSLHLLQ